MERFDFTTQPNRNNTGCAKWNRRTEEEKAAGIVPMSIADMEFFVAPCVAEAMERAARHGVFGYTDADETYFGAVAGWMARRHGFSVEQDWIVPVSGVVPALSVAIRAFSEPGDKVLIQSPGYPPLTRMTEMNGRLPVYSPLRLEEDGYYRMDFDDLRAKAADPHTTLFLLCSPHNPVGRLWTMEELRRVADICAANNVTVISDEIHFDLALRGTHIPFAKAAPEMASRCAVLTSPSKTFNVAGLGLANAILPDKGLRERFTRRLLADGSANVPYFGYHGIIAAYREGAPWLDALLAYVRGNFDFFGQWFARNLPMVRVLPAESTYLAWTDWRALGMTDPELERFVRGEAMLFLDEGTMFGAGGEGFMRFNLALTRGELEKALSRLKEAAKRRKIV